MASMTMTASFLAGSTMAKQPSTTPRRGLIVAKASRTAEGANVEMKNKEESSSGRRDLMFAAAAAAACSIARVAMADEEPKRGSPEAKKKPVEVNFTFQKRLIQTRTEGATADYNYPGIHNTIRSQERQKWEYQILAISNFDSSRASSTSATKKIKFHRKVQKLPIKNGIVTNEDYVWGQEASPPLSLRQTRFESLLVAEPWTLP
ncbi:hypothetical protein SADUNF_Sadunf16G0145000 [Salix dunnii]|uniref:Uncharacterized protein n=1 Tax=Salix dunnii TaxID=1413687 RepID=A0A835JEB5_9ROSI|nr:hypothetical protein SADUNF_Sadunf16G0145000 [Salix dunnii]